MSNETKRDVFGQLLNAYQNLIMKDVEIPDGSYRANITTPWNIVYDDALPDDLPIIPKDASDYMQSCKQGETDLGDNINLIDAAWGAKYGDQATYDVSDWIESNGDAFARAWLLNVWRVEGTGEIVKLEVEK